LHKNLSSCASGKRYVHSYSRGFCVANTKKGDGSNSDCQAMVTCHSCIASNNAACTLGVVLFISSANTILAKIGHCKIEKVLFSGLYISHHVMSLGNMSGVH
jgi:hypothetical protein